MVGQHGELMVISIGFKGGHYQGLLMSDQCLSHVYVSALTFCNILGSVSR